MRKREFVEKALQTSGLLLCLSGSVCQPCIAAHGQSNKTESVARMEQAKIKISGKVMDAHGEPLPGASIQVTGSPRGVTTDIDGTFSIEVSKGEKLEVSFVGMQSQKIIAETSKELVIILQENTDELDEVQVVAFAKQKKSSVVSSISTIKPAELKVPSSNLTTALAGRMAGIISYQRSGEPGQDNAQFFVRGITSFGAESKKDPLILIDNVEMSGTDLARLQPDDIASFSIMKDATGSALYGSRGANGVILVTTKEGKEGKINVSARFETSMSAPTKDVELADPITYMRLHNEAVRTRNPLGLLPYSESKIANTIAGKNPMVYPANDWRELLFKDFTLNERFNFSVSGGGKVARYYISATVNQDNGILKVDGKNNFNNNINLRNYNLRSNVNINLTPTTEVALRFLGNFDDYSGPIDGGSELYKKVMWANPVLFPAVFQPDERNMQTKNILFGNAENGNYLNPYAEMVKGYKDYSSSNIMAQVELKQKLDFLLKGLSARAMVNTTRYTYFDISRSYKPYYYGIGIYDKYNDTYTLESLNEGSEALGYSEGQKNVNAAMYMEAAIDYSYTFAKKQEVTGLLVYTMRNYLEGNAGDLQTSLPFRNMGLAGRVTYAYDDRYLFEANFGYNGSERFAKKHRWGFFPSVGAGYLISNEKFYKNSDLSKILPKMKLKATYGLVGNDQIGSKKDRFFYLSNVNLSDSGKGMNFGTEGAYSRPGVSISRYENEEIGWETAYKTNLGIEIGVLDKIEIQADFFSERRTNILMDRASVPASMGLQAPTRANVGEASGRGFEVAVDYNQFFSNGFWMTGRGNFTYATNEYKVYEEANFENMPWQSHIGRSLQQRWGYVAERLFVDDYDVANSPVQNFGGDVPTMAGDIKYKDINHDGQITNLDQVPIGYPEVPEVIYGFGLSCGWKGFDVSVFFQGSARSSFWINPEETSPFLGKQRALLKAYADNHWAEDNRNVYALWPRLSENTVKNNMQTSTWLMRDGSFLRLKSAEVGYTIPQKETKKIRLDMVRIYLSGTNLLTFSKFKLWDPEMGGDGLGYPVQRVVNAGIQVNF